jgi:thioredoxin 1
MSVLTTGAGDARALADALSRKDRRVIVCLCAAWCDTCEEFRRTFERLSDADRAAAYVWIDIEDDSALLGELDIENFPTLAVFRGGEPLFYGVTLPQEGVVERTLAALSGEDVRPVAVPEEVARLPAALGSRPG